MGDDRYNLLAVAMHQYNITFDDAVALACLYHKHIEAQFTETLGLVPSFGAELDRQLQLYIRGLVNWLRCNVCWSFESSRYFGERGLEYQTTRLVPRLPKMVRDKSHAERREKVMIPSVEELATKVAGRELRG